MKVFLCKGKRISFTFPKYVTWERKGSAVWQRKLKVEMDLIIRKNDVTNYLEDVSSSKNDWRKHLKNVWPLYQPKKALDIVHQQQLNDMVGFGFNISIHSLPKK